MPRPSPKSIHKHQLRQRREENREQQEQSKSRHSGLCSEKKESSTQTYTQETAKTWFLLCSNYIDSSLENLDIHWESLSFPRLAWLLPRAGHFYALTTAIHARLESIPWWQSTRRLRRKIRLPLHSFLLFLLSTLIVFGAAYIVLEQLLTATRASAACIPSTTTVYIPYTTTTTATSTISLPLSPSASSVEIAATDSTSAPSTPYTTVSTFTTTLFSTTTLTVSTLTIGSAALTSNTALNSVTTTVYAAGATPSESLTTTGLTTITLPLYTSTIFSVLSPALTTTRTSTQYVTYFLSAVSPRPSFTGMDTQGWNTSVTMLDPASTAPYIPQITRFTRLVYFGQDNVTTSTSTSLVTMTIGDPDLSVFQSAISAATSTDPAGASMNDPLSEQPAPAAASIEQPTNAGSSIDPVAAGNIPPSATPAGTLTTTLIPSSTADFSAIDPASALSTDIATETFPPLTSAASSQDASATGATTTLPVDGGSLMITSSYVVPGESGSLVTASRDSSSDSLRTAAGLSSARDTTSLAASPSDPSTSSMTATSGFSFTKTSDDLPLGFPNSTTSQVGALSSASANVETQVQSTSVELQEGPSSTASQFESSASPKFSLPGATTSGRPFPVSAATTSPPQTPLYTTVASAGSTDPSRRDGEPETTLLQSSGSEGLTSTLTLTDQSISGATEQATTTSLVLGVTTTLSTRLRTSTIFVTPIPSRSSDDPATSTADSTSPTQGCGEQGNFTMDFDTLPIFNSGSARLFRRQQGSWNSTSNSTRSGNGTSDITQQPPLSLRPYKHLLFSDGYVYSPPPTEPFAPTSPPNVAVFLANGTGMKAGQQPNDLAPGEIADGPYHEGDPAFFFDAFETYLGCDNAGPEPCMMEATRYMWDTEARDDVPSLTQNYTLPACEGYRQCQLTRVVFPPTFRNMSGIRMRATKGGRPRMFFMDDMKMRWTDDSCAAGMRRQKSP